MRPTLAPAFRQRASASLPSLYNLGSSEPTKKATTELLSAPCRPTAPWGAPSIPAVKLLGTVRSLPALLSAACHEDMLAFKIAKLACSFATFVVALVPKASSKIIKCNATDPVQRHT